MKSFKKIFTLIIIFILLIFTFSNIFLFYNNDNGRPYRVEINRISLKIEKYGFETLDLTKYKYVTSVKAYSSDDINFYNAESDYAIREINNILYRFDYITADTKNNDIIILNIILLIMSVFIIGILIFIYTKILLPFHKLNEVPYQLSKGTLTIPIKENKNHFFGKFIWGINLLRENLEEQKERELKLLKDKKTLLLSLSHNIKTPLSAIKLYSKALSKGLYTDKYKQLQIAENINSKADEIEDFICQIIKASSEDFLEFEVTNSEFYLSDLINTISDYYSEKLSLIHLNFFIQHYCDCILQGDLNKSIEILQNILENAIKYGTGCQIEILFSEEEDCQLITVKNDGCTLETSELPHIFESFWRGSNSNTKKGSGLGLYICRQLIKKMNGEIFAEIKDGCMLVTTVFEKAR